MKLLNLDDEEPWKRDAACRECTDPNIFWPERGESLTPAKAYCARCHVRDECLEYAMRLGEKHGIWGGLSERERRRLRAARRKGAA